MSEGYDYYRADGPAHDAIAKYLRDLHDANEAANKLAAEFGGKGCARTAYSTLGIAFERDKSPASWPEAAADPWKRVVKNGVDYWAPRKKTPAGKAIAARLAALPRADHDALFDMLCGANRGFIASDGGLRRVSPSEITTFDDIPGGPTHFVRMRQGDPPPAHCTAIKASEYWRLTEEQAEAFARKNAAQAAEGSNR